MTRVSLGNLAEPHFPAGRCTTVRRYSLFVHLRLHAVTTLNRITTIF